jgi:hypothetical protein
MLMYVENHVTLAELRASVNPHLALLHQRSAQRARRVIRQAMRAAYTAEPVPDAFLTCDGTGGTYELIGIGKGAGPLQGRSCVPLRCYRRPRGPMRLHRPSTSVYGWVDSGRLPPRVRS